MEERITLRLRDPADIAFWKRHCKGKTKNAAGVQLVRMARTNTNQGQLDRIERKVDDLLNMRFVVSDAHDIQTTDAVETDIDAQVDEWA